MVKASMAGSVWKILVEKGGSVSPGQEVVILESMKMEIPIETERGGVVKEVRVKEGDFVNDGGVLIDLE